MSLASGQPLRRGSREVIRCSPAVTDLNSDTAETATITLNEACTVDLDRLGAIACINALTATGLYPTHSFANKIALLDGSQLRGNQPLVVGRNSPNAAFNMDPRRLRPRFVRFGRQDFQSQDTIAIEAIIQGTALKCDFSVAVVSSSGLVAPQYSPTSAPRLLGAAASGDIAADNATDEIKMTADEAGWINMSNLGMECLPTAVAATEEAPNADGLGSLSVHAITLPGGVQLVQGEGDREAPATIWSNQRPYDFVDLGWVYMSAGSVITFEVRNRGVDVLRAAISAPFWADSRGPSGGCR
tara:strand:- start:1398 stop:2297 length:900 start_codon:yes stop_codon:yes gene_type:complete